MPVGNPTMGDQSAAESLPDGRRKSVGVGAANVKGNWAAAKDFPMQPTHDPPLQLTDLFGCFAVNDSVIIEADGDGAIGLLGVVTNVWPSGRCTVTFPDGSFRSLPSKDLRRV